MQMPLSWETFLANVATVRERIATACHNCGRAPDSVTLLPVTKTFPVTAAEYAARAGFSAVGENRVQEAISKIEAGTAAVEWELIGHLQSNKAAQAVNNFARIQTVDSAKLAQRLDRAAQQAGLRQRILLQVNAGDDPAKYGVPCADLPELLDAALTCQHLTIDGLMTIAPLSDDPDVARRCFARLRVTCEAMRERYALPLPELSMGMSGDVEAAIAEGATCVRVGSALFGKRSQP